MLLYLLLYILFVVLLAHRMFKPFFGQSWQEIKKTLTIPLFVAITITVGLAAYSVLPFICETNTKVETHLISPVFHNFHHPSENIYLAGLHDDGEDKVMFSYIEKGKGVNHIKIVPASKSVYLENTGTVSSFDPRRTHKHPHVHQLPYVQIYQKSYKDNWINRYIFLNAKKKVGHNGAIKYMFVIPKGSYHGHYQLEGE